jgi:outer membrane protein OmpA-like peptidoglycan-associated protein
MNRSTRRLLVRAATLAVALLLGCATRDEGEPAPSIAAPTSPSGPVGATSSAAPTSAAGESAAQQPVPVVAAGAMASLALDAAVQRAGERLFSDARMLLGDAPREFVIDPLIDANTGQQTAASVAVGAQLARLVGEKFPMWTVQPLSRKALGQAPLLLIGTLTPVDLNPAPGGIPAGTARDSRPADTTPVDAFRIWLTLADLRTGKIVAKRLDRAEPASVNAEPTRFFRDSATTLKDRTVAAYVNSCQIDARIGDPLDPLYVMRLPAAAILNEAINAYNDNQLALAFRLYGDAARLAEADDLRVLNGRYLTGWRLGRKPEAAAAFSRIVASGLAAKRLALKVLFEPGGTTMLAQGDLRMQYRFWLQEVAKQANARASCLRVVGHSSRTGSAAAGEALSLRRAAVVRWILARDAPRNAGRFSAEGVGWRENLVGLGTDDLRDALDRRVEFRVVDCP